MPKVDQEFVDNLWQEIRLSEKIIETELIPKMRESLTRYTGDFVPRMAKGWDILINEAYTNIQLNLPSTFFQAPHIFCRAETKQFIVKEFDPIQQRRVEVVKDSTKSCRIQEGLHNYLLEEINYKDEIRQVNLDAHLFPYGVSWKGYHGEFGIGDDGSIDLKKEEIFYKRWRPDWLFWDPAATNMKTARWIARKIELPLEDVVANKRFKVSKELRGKQGFQNLVGQNKSRPKSGQDEKIIHPSGGSLDTLINFASEQFRQSSRSQFIELFEVWHRPSQEERAEGKKGVILMLTREQDKPLEEKKWQYDMEGWPANVLAYSPLNDRFVGLSELLVYADQMDEKNAIRNAQLQNAESNANVTLVVDGNSVPPETQRKWREGDNKIIVATPANGDIRSAAMFLSPQQVSSEFYAFDRKNQEDLDKISGISDLRRGIKPPGEETAFAAQQRAAGAAARPLYKVDLMKDFILRDQKQFNQLMKQYFPIDKVIKITGDLAPEWIDDYTKEDIQAEVGFDLDVISMLPPNPDKEAQNLTNVLNLMLGALGNPAVMKKIMSEGNTFNVSPIIQKLLENLNVLDPEIFRPVRAEESKGFVSVSELEAAEANVNAIMKGTPFDQIPSPPEEGQDHEARIRVYTSTLRIFSQGAKESPIVVALAKLIQIQQQIAKEESKKNAPKSGQIVQPASTVSEGIANSLQGVA